MQVLTVSTDDPNLRSEVWGWTHENAELFAPNKPIGMTPPPTPYYHPRDVMMALYDGWKLLGPPIEGKDVDGNGKEITYYQWWLTKEKQ